MDTKDFILLNRERDVRELALQGGRYPEVDMAFALNQIAGWQTARTKLPSWAECADIIYPPHLSMEQCSSEQTALYKASLVEKGVSMTDLTGGFGVDFSFIARRFSSATYVERLADLCDIARRNFEVLELHHADVVCGDGVDFLRTMKPVDFIYLDPARRDLNGSRTYALEDCTPNVIELRDVLLEKARTVMIKLSPMLDWHKVVDDLGCVSEVHVVSVRNECKEMLVVLRRDRNAPLRCYAVNDDETVVFRASDAVASTVRLVSDASEIRRGSYLFEPNASLMKLGCFGLLCERYGVKKIGAHSNLFIADESVDFPGRKFQISTVSSMNKKELRRNLSFITRANIAVRNFPISSQDLRRQLKLKDGGDTYIFATTQGERNHLILVAGKV